MAPQRVTSHTARRHAQEYATVTSSSLLPQLPHKLLPNPHVQSQRRVRPGRSIPPSRTTPSLRGHKDTRMPQQLLTFLHPSAPAANPPMASIRPAIGSTDGVRAILQPQLRRRRLKQDSLCYKDKV